MPRCCGLRRGDAHRGDLRLGIGDARHAVVVDRPDVKPAEPLGDQDALGEAHVRQLRVSDPLDSDQVAHGGDGRHRRPAQRVHLDEPAGHRDPVLLVPEAGRDRAAAHRHEQEFRLELLAVAERDLDAGVGVADRLERRAELEPDAAAAEHPLQHLGGRLVLKRQQLRRHLHDGHRRRRTTATRRRTRRRSRRRPR